MKKENEKINKNKQNGTNRETKGREKGKPVERTKGKKAINSVEPCIEMGSKPGAGAPSAPYWASPGWVSLSVN